MCGIFCACVPQSRADEILNTYENIKPMLKRRGPDYYSFDRVHNSNHTLLCAASVLWMQGKTLNEQPVVDDQSVFMFNGDIFGGIDVTDEGDTTVLHRILKESVDIKTLSKVEGPFSFIYLDKEQSKLYFGRDRLGRRSLLIGYTNSILIISSIAKRSLFRCIELPAVGIFVYDLKTEDFTLLPWECKHPNFFDKIAEVEGVLKKPVIVKGDVKIQQTLYSPPTDSNLSFLQELSQDDPNNIFLKILNNVGWSHNIQNLRRLLEKATEIRVKTQLDRCRNCLGKTNDCQHCTIGVLFSGGIDCTVLTLLIDQYIDKKRPIDLLNVAFNSKAPDRETGLQTLEELRRLRPDRNWNFIELNVSQDELNEAREQYVADLIYPLNTILDESLGCALWFASRGQQNDYVSSCRVLFTGMGADELFGGYTKHRASFKRSGWEGLHQSLEDDWQNLSFRNLARDDRVISDHGRQLRTPYLDEKVVKFTRSLNCSERTCPSDYLPVGIGEKMLLRSLAYSLGLRNGVTFKKRALQFGSRIANRKENARDVSHRLQLQSYP